MDTQEEKCEKVHGRCTSACSSLQANVSVEKNIGKQRPERLTQCLLVGNEVPARRKGGV